MKLYVVCGDISSCCDDEVEIGSEISLPYHLAEKLLALQLIKDPDVTEPVMTLPSKDLCPSEKSLLKKLVENQNCLIEALIGKPTSICGSVLVDCEGNKIKFCC